MPPATAAAASPPIHGRSGALPPRRSAAPPPARRKKRSALGAWAVPVYLLFVVGISALLAGVGWMWASDVLALNKAEHTAAVEIEAGDTVADVADKLKDAGLIEYKFVFRLFCAFTHVSGAAGRRVPKSPPAPTSWTPTWTTGPWSPVWALPPPAG